MTIFYTIIGIACLVSAVAGAIYGVQFRRWRDDKIIYQLQTKLDIAKAELKPKSNKKITLTMGKVNPNFNIYDEWPIAVDPADIKPGWSAKLEPGIIHRTSPPTAFIISEPQPNDPHFTWEKIDESWEVVEDAPHYGPRSVIKTIRSVWRGIAKPDRPKSVKILFDKEKEIRFDFKKDVEKDPGEYKI